MGERKLTLAHVFGSTCSKRNRHSLAVYEEEKNETIVMFPAGKCMAKKYYDRFQMQFIGLQENIEQISLVCILPTKQYVAVVYKPYNISIHRIAVYPVNGVQKPLTLKIFDENQKIGTIHLLACSASEPRFICVLLGQPHNKLVFINIHKEKALAESSFSGKEFECLTICPYNSHLIAISSQNVLRLFKVEEYTFKPLEEVKKLQKNRKITDHVWYRPKMLLITTDKNQVIILSETKPNTYETIYQYSNIFHQSIECHWPTIITTFSKGFIVGSNKGKFALWANRIQDDDFIKGLQLVQKWSTAQQRTSEVVSIELSAKEDIMVVALSNQDIATFSLSDILLQKTQQQFQLQGQSKKQVVFEYIYKGFHNKAITGLDICQQRPLIASCSHQDSTVRIWDYRRYDCKMLRMFYFRVKQEQQKPLITLAFHPCGYYLAVACTDKLRFFHILYNQLRPYRQLLIRNARMIRFSNGGNMIAVGYPLRQGVDTIKIYNAITLVEIFNLKQCTSLLCSMQFKENDQCLFVITQTQYFQWRTNDWVVVRSQKGPLLNKGVYLNNSILYMSGKTLYSSQNAVIAKFEKKVVGMSEIKITKEEKGVVLAFENGTILAVEQPLSKFNIFDTHSEHTKGTEFLVVSPCGRYLITAGADCMILIYKMEWVQEGTIAVDDYLSDVVLIDRHEVREIQAKEKQYTFALTQLTTKLKQSEEEALKKHTKEVQDLVIQKNRVIEDFKQRINKVKQQIKHNKQGTGFTLATIDKNNLQKLSNLQKEYNVKIQMEVQKYFQLQQEIIKCKCLHTRNMQTMKVAEQARIAKLKQSFEDKFKASQSVYVQAKHEAEEANTLFEQKLKQLEQEQEEEIKDIQAKTHIFRTQAATQVNELLEKQSKMKKQHDILTEQRESYKNKRKKQIFMQKKIEKQIQETKEKLKNIYIEQEEKIQSLKEKEQRILEFQAKINQLQKKKHILSYKGTEMKKAIEPKEQLIEKLKTDLIKLKQQFQQSLQKKQKNVLSMQRNQKQRRNLQRNLIAEQQETQKQMNLLQKIIVDLYHSIQYKQQSNIKQDQSVKNQHNSKHYFKEAVRLYHKYVDKQEKISAVGDPNGVNEITKQITHLQKSLFQLNKNNEKILQRKNQEISKRTKENAELVNNLNELKKENKDLSLKIQAKKIEVERLKGTKTSMLSEGDIVTHNGKQIKNQIELKQTHRSVTKLIDKNDCKNTLKKENQLISDIQFTNEKQNRLNYAIRELKQLVLKHKLIKKCSYQKE